MKSDMRQYVLTLVLGILGITSVKAQDPVFSQVVSGTSTTITISDFDHSAVVDPMIYGQMLEDCNDHVVYGGVVNEKGEDNMSVLNQLKRLNIPVMRWPGGTCIYDYEWRKGVGSSRTSQQEKIWGGHEYYTFGTDEYIAWCRKIGTEPYINIPMGNNNTYTHSLGEALDWVEYVNGPSDSPMGAYRSRNGHADPYNVRYWCLGNENYLGNTFHISESASEYAETLHSYASILKQRFPNMSILGVGHTGTWNKTVLEQCGQYLDFMTLHFYMNAKVQDKVLLDPSKTLFAPERVEANIRHFVTGLKSYNEKTARSENPIRFSIDEWNCRHSVQNEGKFSFTRKDARRQYDAASVASMLNVFIRTSPYVGMANYIFPVNGHGLLKTVGEQDAYATPCYHVFDLYRKFMNGRAIGVDVSGPGIKDVSLSELSLEGDNDSSLNGKKKDMCYIDCSATLNDDGNLAVSLVNRSYNTKQKVRLSVPKGYEITESWVVSHDNVNVENTAERRDNVTPCQVSLKSNKLMLNPCAVAILVLKRIR